MTSRSELTWNDVAWALLAGALMYLVEWALT